jgi:subtilisin family serine protease
MRPARRRASLLAGLVLLAALVPLQAPALATQPAPSASTKLRGDLAALVSGQASLDTRIPGLVAGYRSGEIPFFAYLDANTSARRAALQDLGARVLRSYASVPAVALAASPVDVLRVAEKSWVSWLAPVEVVVKMDGPEPYGDQTRGTPADLGAPGQWDAGITGAGVRIAILDTGIDASHPDLNDQDFRRWSSLLPNATKVVEQRDFVGGQCLPVVGVQDGNGHGTHVAGIAAGTGSGNPALASDNGKYTGIAPDAELVVAKVLSDAGAGLNSDLIAAMEWAATPASQAPLGCGAGAQIVNMSLGSEVRPGRQNSGADLDLVSIALDRLAVTYGTLFVASAGNQGPFIGSQLEAPGAAAQVLSVGATAKDWDLNHDDTYSGDNCAGYQHPSDPPSFADNTCDQGPGTQPSSLSSLSSRGPTGDLWLRPDVTAPGYYIVSAQSSTGTGIASQDINLNTRADPLYATASGTSMAAPAATGSAALLLQAYRVAYGSLPSGASGTSALSKAPPYALVRAALMNTAGGDLLEARLTAKTDLATIPNCDLPPDQVPFICDFINVFPQAGQSTVYEVRNGPADPYVGPLGEGAGKIRINQAVQALRDGVVVYSVASGSGVDAGTGPRDFQGSWQVGAVTAGTTQAQRFVVHGAPGSGKVKVSFAFSGGNPSDGSRAIPTSGTGAWSVQLPGTTSVAPGGDAIVTFKLTIPASTAPGLYTGIVLATTTQGVTLRVPVFAAIAMHDPNPAAGNVPGPQATAALDDAFAKSDTLWPSVIGSAGTGAGSDWNVYPVELASGLSEARFSVYSTAGNETYDLYLYDAALNLISSTHPFLPPGQASGTTDTPTYESRAASTAAAPQALALGTPAAGRHYVVVNRAVVGRPGPQPAGNFGGFRLSLDEIRASAPARPSQLSYEGDYIWSAGGSIRLAARLSDPAGSATGTPIAGRQVTFTVDAGAGICGASPCQATTDYTGIAQLASAPITLAPGVHEVHARFAGDAAWLASADDAFVIVVGAGGPPPPPGGSAGKVTAGGWFLPDDATSPAPSQRIHFAFQATSTGGVAPTGELRYRDVPGGLELTLVAWTTMLVDGDTVTLTGTGRDAAGNVAFILTVTDAGEPGKGADTIRLQVPENGYDRSGTLGGGDIQLH